jgi:hypothetical protein
MALPSLHSTMSPWPTMRLSITPEYSYTAVRSLSFFLHPTTQGSLSPYHIRFQQSSDTTFFESIPVTLFWT